MDKNKIQGMLSCLFHAALVIFLSDSEAKWNTFSFYLQLFLYSVHVSPHNTLFLHHITHASITICIYFSH